MATYFQLAPGLQAKLTLTVAIVVGAWSCQRVSGDFREPFESAETSWRLAENDCQARILRHQREFGSAHTGQGCEYIQLVAGQGTRAYLVHQVDPARVINELNPSLWIKSDQPGLQLMARVVLPRTKDPRTGAPMTTLLRGPLYEQRGSWQRLVLKDADLLLDREIRKMSWQLKKKVPREQAYIDLLVINGYGGPGFTHVRIDDLEMANPVISTVATARTGQPKLNSDSAAGPRPDAGRGAVRPPYASKLEGNSEIPGANPSSDVRVEGGMVLADTRPFMARIIEHRGESLQWLASLGFNTVALHGPPTAEQLAEASRYGIWLVAPPPDAAGRAATGQADRILAWNLGDELELDSLERVRQDATTIQRGLYRRPTVCEPRRAFGSFSRVSSILQISIDPWGTSQDLKSLSVRLKRQLTEVRNGTPVWVSIATHWNSQAIRQGQIVGTQLPPVVDIEQFRLAVAAAAAAGARGFHFASNQRLDGSDLTDKLRRKTLELLNRELELLEPWVSSAPGHRELVPSAPDLRISQLRTPRSRLVLITHESNHEQIIPDVPVAKPIPLRVPAIPRTYAAYDLHPTANLEPIAGGHGGEFTLTTPRRVSYVVVTDNEVVRQFLAKQSRSDRREAWLQLSMDVAGLRIQHTRKTTQILPRSTAWGQTSERQLQQAAYALNKARGAAKAGQLAAAVQQLQSCQTITNQLRRRSWEKAITGFSGPAASPACLCFESLAAHYSLASTARNSTWGGNLLIGSQMEDLAQLQRAGWTRTIGTTREAAANVELSLQSPHSGRMAMRIWSWPTEDGKHVTRPMLEEPPIRMVTAPVQVREGDFIQVQGWLRIPDPIQRTLEGCRIYDSQAGPPLAVRWQQTRGWQRFGFYRAATASGPFTVTIELDGIGEVWIDDITIRVLQAAQ